MCRAVSQLQLEGVNAAAAKCDVSKKHEVDQLVAWTVQTYGGLDILVANAGIVKVCVLLCTGKSQLCMLYFAL